MTVNFSDGHRARAGSVPPWGRRGKSRTSPTVAGNRQGWPQMPVKAKTINAASDTAGRATGQGRRQSGPTWNPYGARMPGRVPGWPSVPLSAGRSGEPRPRTHHRHRHGRGGDRDRRTPARTAKGVQGGCRAFGGGTTERPPRIRAQAPRAEPVGGCRSQHDPRRRSVEVQDRAVFIHMKWRGTTVGKHAFSKAHFTPVKLGDNWGTTVGTIAGILRDDKRF